MISTEVLEEPRVGVYDGQHRRESDRGKAVAPKAPELRAAAAAAVLSYIKLRMISTTPARRGDSLYSWQKGVA